MPRLLRALVSLRDAAAAVVVLLPSAATFLRDLAATLQSLPSCTLTAFRRRALVLLGRDATPLRSSASSDPSAPADGSNEAPYGKLIVRLEDNDPQLTELKLWRNVLLEDNDPRGYLEVGNLKDLNEAETWCLGRAIGRSTHLKKLSLCDCDLDMAGLCDGLKDNESIEHLDLSKLNLSDADMTSLAPCFSQNPSLRSIEISQCGVGPDGVNLGILSDALSSRKESLHELNLCEILTVDDAMDQLAEGLVKNRELHTLSFSDCDVDLAGCPSLLALLENPASSLRVLGLSDNSIDGEGARILVASLSKNTKLETLDLDWNNQIGDQGGCCCLATLLENAASSLSVLNLCGTSIDDEGARILAASLSRNTKIRTLNLACNELGYQGWGEMLDLVCKGTSVGSIRASNHTLTSLWGDDKYAYLDEYFLRDIVAARTFRWVGLLLASLKLNEQEDKAFVAQRKMLWCHAHGLLNLGTSPEVKDVSISTILSSFGDPSDDTIAKLFEYQDLPLPGNDNDDDGKEDCGHNDDNDHDDDDDDVHGHDHDQDHDDNNNEDADADADAADHESGVDAMRLDSVYRIIRSRPNMCSQAEVVSGSE